LEAIGEQSQALGIDFNRQLTSGITASAFAHGYAVVLIAPLDRPEQMLDTPFDGARSALRAAAGRRRLTGRRGCA